MLCGGGVHLSPEHLLGEGVWTPQELAPPLWGGGLDPPGACATSLGGGVPQLCTNPRPPSATYSGGGALVNEFIFAGDSTTTILMLVPKPK